VPETGNLEKIEKMLKDVGEKELDIGIISEKPAPPEHIEEEYFEEKSVEEPGEKPKPPSEPPESEQELDSLLRDIEIGLEQEKELEEKFREEKLEEEEVEKEAESEEIETVEEVEGLETEGEKRHEEVGVPEEVEGGEEAEEGEEIFDLPGDFDLEKLVYEEKPPQTLMKKEERPQVKEEGEEVYPGEILEEEAFAGETVSEQKEIEETFVSTPETVQEAEKEEELEVPKEEFDLPGLEEILKETEIEEPGKTPSEVTEEISEQVQEEVPYRVEELPEEVQKKVPEPSEKAEEPGIEVEEVSEEEIELSDEDIILIKTKLKQLDPWVASIVRDIIIGDELSFPQIKGLIDLLIQDASQSRIINYIEEVTGRRIVPPRKPPEVIPAVRKPGLAVALENLAPLVRIAGLFVIIAALVGTLFMVFVFKPLKANQYYREGIEFIKMGEYGLAEESFERAVEIYEKIEEYDKFGWEYALSGNYDLAIKKLSTGIAKDVALKNINLRLHLAKIYNILEKYDEADKLYDAVIEKEPSVYEYIELKGENLIDWGIQEPEKLDQAYELFKSEHTESPRNSNPLFQMLYIAILKDSKETVDSLYEYIKTRFPQAVDKKVYTALAAYYLDENYLEPVRDILASVVKTFSYYPQAYFEFARYYRAINNKQQEEKVLKLTIKAENRRVLQYPWEKTNYTLLSRAYNNLGELYNRLEIPGKSAEAINYFKKAIEADPSNKEAYFNLGQTYFYNENNYTFAFNYYDKAFSMGYRNNDLYYNLGVLHFFNRSFEKALHYWSELYEIMPDNPNIIYAIGTTFLHLGKYNSALGEFLMLSEIYDRLMKSLGEIRPWSAYHRQIVMNAAAVYNNLGVAYQKLFETTGKAEYQTQSLVFLYKGGELADIIGEERGKIQYNINYILHPEVIRGNMAINDDISKNYRFETR